MQIPFIGGSYNNRSFAIDSQECINWYLEMYGQQEEAKSQKALLPTPGLKLFVDSMTTKPVRGMFTTSTGRMFAAIGSKLYEYTSSGREIIRGTLKTSSGTVNFDDNGDSTDRGRGMILVDNAYGYMLNLTDNTFQQILDPSFPVCTHVVFLDGYFIVNEVNSGRIWLSNLYNGLDWGDIQVTVQTQSILATELGSQTMVTSTAIDITGITSVVLSSGFSSMSGTIVSYDPVTGILNVNVTSVKGVGTYNNWIIQMYSGSTAFATAESSPDNLAAIASIHGELWLVGDQSTEIWYNNTTVAFSAEVINKGFPFQRIHGGMFNGGTIAKYSVSNNASSIFWLGSSTAGHGQVWTSQAYQPRKISTPSIDNMIESLPVISDAISWVYTQNGHNFYVLNFPTGDKTFVYDVSNNEWHERAYWNGKSFESHLSHYSCFAFGKNYVGDRKTGRIYELDLNTYTDNGDVIRRVRTGPHIHSDRRRLRFNVFEIDCERGVGLDGQTSDQGTGQDPAMILQWSDDGGRTWSNEYWSSVGPIGDYLARLRWTRLGTSRDRMFRVVGTEPVKYVLIDARADIEVKEN